MNAAEEGGLRLIAFDTIGSFDQIVTRIAEPILVLRLERCTNPPCLFASRISPYIRRMSQYIHSCLDWGVIIKNERSNQALLKCRRLTICRLTGLPKLLPDATPAVSARVSLTGTAKTGAPSSTLGFTPQKRPFWNPLLPYADALDEESNRSRRYR